jgi:hypothetical protein
MNPHRRRSASTPLIIAAALAFLSGCCWLLKLAPADAVLWSEKRWSIHQADHLTEAVCMDVFALLAILFFGVALYRWLRYRKQRNDREVPARLPVVQRH